MPCTFKNIVVPFDFSEPAAAAVDTAIELAGGPQHVHVLHVLEPIIDVEANLLWTNVDERARRANSEQAIQLRFNHPKYQGLRITTVLGDPGHQVARHAASIAAELIVIPSHGRTGLTRLLIGSVAERVVRLADCPVLVLKVPPLR